MEVLILSLALSSPVYDAGNFATMAIRKESDDIAPMTVQHFAMRLGLVSYEASHFSCGYIWQNLENMREFPQIWDSPLGCYDRDYCRRAWREAEAQKEYYSNFRNFILRDFPQMRSQERRTWIWYYAFSYHSASHHYARRYYLSEIRELIGPEAFARWEVPGPIE